MSELERPGGAEQRRERRGGWRSAEVGESATRNPNPELVKMTFT